MTLKLTVGDRPTLSGTINATTIGATAEVNIKRPDRTVVTRAATTIVDNGDGTSSWSLDLVDGDLTIPGWHDLEVQVTYSNGKPQTFAYDKNDKSVQFQVRQQIA